MEETLSLQSERDFLRAVEENSQFLLTTFTQRHRRFDGETLFSVFDFSHRVISKGAHEQNVWLALGLLCSTLLLPSLANGKA